ncbi:MAG: nucleoside deaminase [Alphaproteobacteria bacterium]
MTGSHEEFMDRCLAESRLAMARGDSPIAAMVVRDGAVLGLGQNVARSTGDPTAHAEVQAIRAACTHLGTLDLSGTTLYSPLEPCPMCCGAMVAARVSRLVLGARNAAIGRRVYGGYTVEGLLATLGSGIEIVQGVRARDCEELRRGWEAAQAR